MKDEGGAPSGSSVFDLDLDLDLDHGNEEATTASCIEPCVR